MKVGASFERQSNLSTNYKKELFRNYNHFNALTKLYMQISICTYLTFFFYMDGTNAL
jgi:hypothetical protein